MKAKLLKIDQQDHLVISTKNEAEGFILRHLFNNVRDTDKLEHRCEYHGFPGGGTVFTIIIKE